MAASAAAPIHAGPPACGPVVWNGDVNGWILTRYAAVRAAFLDAETFAVADRHGFVRRLGDRAGRRWPAVESVLESALFFMDPLKHPQARRLVARVLNDRPVRSYVPAMEAIAEGLLAKGRAAGGLDLTRDFAATMPFRVMATLFGLPEADVPFLIETTQGLLAILNFYCALRDYDRFEVAVARALAHLSGIVGERRRAPHDDGISRFIGLTDADGGLADEQIAAFCYFLLLAGTETTSAFISLSIRTLLERPEAASTLRAGGVAMATAVEELLRHQAPLQITPRIVLRPLLMDGQRLCTGQNVVLHLAAANRDPAQFPDPDALVFDRPQGHLTFGEGIHFCLGATLLRLESAVALAAFLRCPTPRLLPIEAVAPAFDAIQRPQSIPVLFS